MQLAYGIGPLMVVSLMGSAVLAGLSVALLGFSRFLVAYPVGKITDTYGRKPGIMIGLVLALIGVIAVGSGMAIGSFWIFLVGFLIFGMGMSARSSYESRRPKVPRDAEPRRSASSQRARWSASSSVRRW